MRRYHARYVLLGYAYDIERMVREEQDPKDVLRFMKKKLKFLQGSNYYKVIWWNQSFRKEAKPQKIEIDQLIKNDFEPKLYENLEVESEL